MNKNDYLNFLQEKITDENTTEDEIIAMFRPEQQGHTENGDDDDDPIPSIPTTRPSGFLKVPRIYIRCGRRQYASGYVRDTI
jgi:hypothetical protein